MTRHPQPRGQLRWWSRAGLNRAGLAAGLLRWASGLALGLAALAAGGRLHAAAPGSAHYTWREPALDAGGGIVSSLNYRLVSSLGLPGGSSRSADGLVSNQQGFISALNDPPSPQTDTVRSQPDFSARMWIGNLLANDDDPEGDLLGLRDFDTRTSAGGRVTREGNTLLYTPPNPLPVVDTFYYTMEDAAGNPATALVILLVTEAIRTPPPNQLAAALLPDGSTYLALSGLAGRTYDIEWSDRMPATRWEVLATVRADGRGLVEWVDATEHLLAERYYRTSLSRRNPNRSR